MAFVICWWFEGKSFVCNCTKIIKGKFLRKISLPVRFFFSNKKNSWNYLHDIGNFCVLYKLGLKGRLGSESTWLWSYSSIVTRCRPDNLISTWCWFRIDQTQTRCRSVTTMSTRSRSDCNYIKTRCQSDVPMQTRCR